MSVEGQSGGAEICRVCAKDGRVESGTKFHSEDKGKGGRVPYEYVARPRQLVLSFLVLLLVFGFGIDDGSCCGIDMHFRHLAIGSQYFDFPDRLVMLLFEFGLDRCARGLSPRRS